MFTADDDVLHYGLLHLITFYNVGADDDVDYEEEGYDDYDDVDNDLCFIYASLPSVSTSYGGGWYGEGVVHLTPPECPTDIGLQLGVAGKACSPCSR